MLPDYNPAQFEGALMQEDFEAKRFRSEIKPDKKAYTIVMPPPNVTGMLHMGHILNNTIQDVLIRYKRMNGFEACWIPGLDHASIATESKVTRWLAGQNIDKFVIGRDKFLEHAMKWKDQYGGIINTQLRRLGVSCDWTRERFTMDPDYSKDVLQAFVDLYNEGLIYKGTRMVNWCPVTKSAISDEEVEHIEEQGSLWHFAYPIKDTKDRIVIATTRPETMFGDSAVMVNPNDERYQHLIGKTVLLPLVNREIPIIADDYVDTQFGTGAVKVTPAHDVNDYEVGKRHALPHHAIFTNDAHLNNQVPESYRGLDRFEARSSVVAAMKHLGLVVKIEPHTHKVGYSQRGHVPIEPMLSDQWFMKMKPLAEPARKLVEEGQINFYPDHWKKTYYYWLDNIKDWCISRQLWWGHRIPVYTCECGCQKASLDHFHECPQCKKPMVQEEDVLDTWASSWLWSYAVHHTEEERNYYHPTDTLVTGPDIIFFWVARMIMSAWHFRKEIPFKNVYFTGIIRDEQGRKMSKSLGNSPDPLDEMDTYGVDALRYTIIRLAPTGNDILYASEKVEQGKFFANKIWNAARFLVMHAEQNNFDPKEIKDAHLLDYPLDDFDKSMVVRFHQTLLAYHEDFEKFRFNDVAKRLYDFIWGDFCDRYVESSKHALSSPDTEVRVAKLRVALVLFRRILRMLHPVMPFISEKLWRDVFGESNIAFAVFPQYRDVEQFNPENANMYRLERAVYLIRELRAESNVPPSATPQGIISAGTGLNHFLRQNSAVIQKLARLSSLEIVDAGRVAQKGEAVRSEHDFQVFLNLEGTIDKTQEIARLEKEIARLEGVRRAFEGKLSNQQFISKAPAEVIAKEKTKLEEIKSELLKNQEALKTWL